MGEINNTGEEEIIDPAENGNDNQDESQKDVTTEDKGDSDQNDQQEESNEEDKTDSDEKPTPADEEPKTRKRNIDFILERKNRKIEKLESKVDEKEDSEDEDDFVDPDAQKLVQKEVQKALSPFLQKQIEEEDNNEINSFLQENPDFKPYADKVRKFAQHESRKHLPIKSIFYEVAGPDLLKIGADRAKKAGDEAKESNAGGGGGDTSTAEKGVWELTPEEFAQKQEELRNKPRP